MTLGRFYRQTWWLWLLFTIVLLVCAYFVSLIFLFGIPILAVYSVYFGIVRVAEIRAQEKRN